MMRRITAKLDFLTAMSVEVCQRNDNQLPNFCFCDHCGWNVFKMKLKILILRGGFDIIAEIRLSGVAKQGYTMLYGKSQINLNEGTILCLLDKT